MDITKDKYYYNNDLGVVRPVLLKADKHGCIVVKNDQDCYKTIHVDNLHGMTQPEATYPHPDFPKMKVKVSDIPWSDSEVGNDIMAFTSVFDLTPKTMEGFVAEVAVRQFMTLVEGRYDSIDREWAFTILSEKLNMPYEAFYQAWLNFPDFTAPKVVPS